MNFTKNGIKWHKKGGYVKKTSKMVKTPCLVALFCDFGIKKGGSAENAKNVKKC